MRVHVWGDGGMFPSLSHPNYFLFCLNTHMCVSACLFVRVFLFAPLHLPSVIAWISLPLFMFVNVQSFLC